MRVVPLRYLFFETTLNSRLTILLLTTSMSNIPEEGETNSVGHSSSANGYIRVVDTLKEISRNLEQNAVFHTTVYRCFGYSFQSSRIPASVCKHRVTSGKPMHICNLCASSSRDMHGPKILQMISRHSQLR